MIKLENIIMKGISIRRYLWKHEKKIVKMDSSDSLYQIKNFTVIKILDNFNAQLSDGIATNASLKHIAFPHKHFLSLR